MRTRQALSQVRYDMFNQRYLLGRQGALHYQEQAGASPEVSNEDDLGSLKLWLELG
jgi:hypothetical protein